MKSQEKNQINRIYLSNNLKFLRRRARQTQTDLAKLLGVKTNTISNWENGVSNPSFEELDIIVKNFDVSTDQILYKNIEENESLIFTLSPGANESLNESLNAEKHQGPVVDMVQSEEIVYGGRRYPTVSTAAPSQNTVQLGMNDDDVIIIYKVSGQLKADLLAGALKKDWQGEIDRLKADLAEIKRIFDTKV